MTLVRGAELPEEFAGGIVTIGNFDGVHRGHQAMLAELKRLANAFETCAVVLTFEPHPLQLLRPEHVPPRLTSLEQKAELLAANGVDAVLAYPTDRSLLGLTPEAFFSQVVRNGLRARGLVEGPNFCFGKDRAGDVTTLKRLCDAAGLACEIINPITHGDELISSSNIRARIAAGQVEQAAEQLGRCHRIAGTVAADAGRGAAFGFPTANLTDVELLIPANGVYAAVANVNGLKRPAAVNIGPNPTFGDMRQKLEVHLLDYSGDLYGRTLQLDFLTRLRDVRDFPNTTALKSQIEQDLKAVRAVADDAASR